MTARDYLGTGWRFPIRVTSRGSIASSTAEAKIQESIWVILGTRPGERQMLPEFGCGIHDLVFAPNNHAIRGEVAARVQGALTRWERRIEVLGVTVTAGGDDQNLMLIRVDYRVPSHNSFGNVVYPFYVEGGGTA